MRSAILLLLLIPTLSYADTHYTTGNEDYFSKEILHGQGTSNVMQNPLPCDKVEVIKKQDRRVDISFSCNENSASLDGEINSTGNISDDSYIVVMHHVDTAGGLGGGQAIGACVVTSSSVNCHGSNIDQSWDFDYKLSE